MHTARALTQAEAEALRGQPCYNGNIFNPVTDANGAWFISNEEAERNENAAFAWVAHLPQQIYAKPPLSNDDPLLAFTNH